MSGTVYLVGAGCGNPDLITWKGLRLLRACDAVFYDDLSSPKLLEETRTDCERLFVGKRYGRHSMPQAEINALLVAKAQEGKMVVRLKGGDPFVFGRGGEEVLALQAAGIPYEVVSGVSSAVAVPAAAGIPVTHRRLARSFHVITGHTAADGAETLTEQPETLAKLENGTLSTFPLAGTRPRGKTREEDKELEEGLLKDEKELAEHNMLVDLGRNDIGKISKIGTVKVEKYLCVERFSHVMHLGSTVTGIIRDDKDAVDAVDAILPAGTLSGAPKFRACQIIEELEQSKRGIYGGAIGYLDFAGNLDTCIAIRLVYKKNGEICIRSGAGIVADSVPEKEFQECCNKARAVVQAIEQAQEGLE